MKRLYTIIFATLTLSWAFSQKVEIVSSDDNLNYAGQTITISGNEEEISKIFYVKNIGSTTQFYWARTITSQSSPEFLVQLCDENICYNTTGKLWTGPIKTIAFEDSLYFKPQLTTKGISGTAEVVYFILDENKNKFDSLTVIFSSTASINNQEEILFSIYPNPAQDYISLQGEILKNGGNAVFLDALGKEVKNISFNSSNAKINISNLKRGVYFVNIYNNEGVKSTTQRLIKQ